MRSVISQLSPQVHPQHLRHAELVCARAHSLSRIIMQKSFQQLDNYGNNFFNLLMATPAVLFIGSRTRAWLKSANKK
jgi:hypothetical protein